MLMCEFDTLSDTGEVIDVIYKTVRESIINEQTISASATCGLIGRIGNLRGLFEGAYRQTQFMNIMKRFIGETEDGDIRRKLILILGC
jgi:hypothetical protein